ncbi:MAG: hypothetical protein ACXABY_04570 [Candidatus Thorarchaeota archaeon]|jgi:hypothetical protein
MKIYGVKDLKSGEWYDNRGYFTTDKSKIRFYSTEAPAKRTRTRETNYQVQWHDDPKDRRELVVFTAELTMTENDSDKNLFEVVAQVSGSVKFFEVTAPNEYHAIMKTLEHLQVTGIQQIEVCQGWVGSTSGNDYSSDLCFATPTAIGE